MDVSNISSVRDAVIFENQIIIIHAAATKFMINQKNFHLNVSIQIL